MMEKELNVIELFGGIGACTKALKNLGVKVNIIDYVEIDKYACKSYNAINNTNFEPQDIMKWDLMILILRRQRKKIVIHNYINKQEIALWLMY